MSKQFFSVSIVSKDLPTVGAIFLTKDGAIYRVPPAVADSLRSGRLQVLLFKNLLISGQDACAKATMSPDSPPVLEFFDSINGFDNPNTVKNNIIKIVNTYQEFIKTMKEVESLVETVFGNVREVIKI